MATIKRTNAEKEIIEIVNSMDTEGCIKD
jgi:hypothetical protein